MQKDHHQWFKWFKWFKWFNKSWPITLTLMLVFVSCRPQTPAPVPTADMQVIAQGKQLYQSLACNSCHGLEAVGSVRTYAPSHNHMAVMAEQRIHTTGYTGKATTAADYIRESIVDPKAYIVPGYEHIRFSMPSFAHLSERDVDALVQFLLQQQ